MFNPVLTVCGTGAFLTHPLCPITEVVPLLHHDPKGPRDDLVSAFHDSERLGIEMLVNNSKWFTFKTAVTKTLFR